MRTSLVLLTYFFSTEKVEESQKEPTKLVLVMTIKEVLVNAMGGIDKVRRKRLPLAKSSCFQAKEAQSDCVPDVNTYREMKKPRYFSGMIPSEGGWPKE